MKIERAFLSSAKPMESVNKYNIVEGKDYSKIRFYNPHPRGLLTGDCVKRAIHVAFGNDYKEVAKELREISRIEKDILVSKGRMYEEDHLPNNIEMVFAKYFNRNGRSSKIIGRTKLREQGIVKVSELANTLKEGTYIALTRTHIVTVIDGVAYDTWNSLDLVVEKAWRVDSYGNKAN